MKPIKETPILFSTPMVKGILNNSKNRTRRTSGLEYINENPDDWHFLRIESIEHSNNMPETGSRIGATFVNKDNKEPWIRCKYGKVGDLLWVREEHKIWYEIKESSKCETWFCEFLNGDTISVYSKKLTLKTVLNLRKRKTLGKWQRSRFLPKGFTRIWLEITNIRVERLQSITEEDAIAEGIEKHFSDLFQEDRFKDYLNHESEWRSATSSFESLWISINGSDSWDLNPWVWVIEFKQIEKPTSHE